MASMHTLLCKSIAKMRYDWKEIAWYTVHVFGDRACTSWRHIVMTPAVLLIRESRNLAGSNGVVYDFIVKLFAFIHCCLWNCHSVNHLGQGKTKFRLAQIRVGVEMDRLNNSHDAFWCTNCLYTTAAKTIICCASYLNAYYLLSIFYWYFNVVYLFIAIC